MTTPSSALAALLIMLLIVIPNSVESSVTPILITTTQQWNAYNVLLANGRTSLVNSANPALKVAINASQIALTYLNVRVAFKGWLMTLNKSDAGKTVTLASTLTGLLLTAITVPVDAKHALIHNNAQVVMSSTTW